MKAARRLHGQLPPGSIVLYDRIQDMTTVVVNSGPWYPGKNLDLYRLAKALEVAGRASESEAVELLSPTPVAPRPGRLPGGE